jgi:predicted nucleic acid-binding protein
VVIADASPLIGLARVDHLHLLPRLFGTVVVTRAVADELLQGGRFRETALLERAFGEPWLEVAEPGLVETQAETGSGSTIPELMSLYLIDPGEASSLLLAQQTRSRGGETLLLIDDHRGREAARHLQFAVLGTAGLLLLARREGVIKAVKPVLGALRDAGYFLSERLVEAVLGQAGE